MPVLYSTFTVTGKSILKKAWDDILEQLGATSMHWPLLATTLLLSCLYASPGSELMPTHATAGETRPAKPMNKMGDEEARFGTARLRRATATS